MRVYTAHLHLDRDPILVREGWTWLGFFLGPLWLLAARAWIPALFVLAADILVAAAAPAAYQAPLFLGLALLVGLLGRDLRRWSLAIYGRPAAAVIVARDELEALRRLYDATPDLIEADV